MFSVNDSIVKVVDECVKKKVTKKISFEYKVVICAGILLVAFILGSLFGMFISNRTPHVVDIERYVVKSGDTVWEIHTDSPFDEELRVMESKVEN